MGYDRSLAHRNSANAINNAPVPKSSSETRPAFGLGPGSTEASEIGRVLLPPVRSPGSQMQSRVPHSHQLPYIVCPANATVTNGVDLMPSFEYEKNIGSASMQTVAKSNLVLMSSFSFKRVAGPARRPSAAALYQAITLKLTNVNYTSRNLLELASSLTSAADYAYDIRRLDLVAGASHLMLALSFSRQFEIAGQFYEALSLNQFGRGNSAQADAVFQKIADGDHSRQRSRALLALGSNSLAARENKTAIFHYREIIRMMKYDRVFDPATLYFTHRMNAVVKAAEDDHRGALSDLEKLSPLVRSASVQQPYAYYDYLNALAVELTAAGRLQEAKNAARIALASPFAHAYPEWRDTLDDIEHRELRASRSTIAVTKTEPTETNLTTLPTRSRESAMTTPDGQSRPVARIIKFPARTQSKSVLNQRSEEMDPLDKGRIVSEKLYEMFLSALDGAAVNRELVDELYKVFLRKRKPH